MKFSEKRHEAQLNALINEYEENGDPNNVAMRAIKKDSTFRTVMETQKDLKDTERFDWLESTELAIDKRKFLLNRLFGQQAIPGEEG